MKLGKLHLTPSPADLDIHGSLVHLGMDWFVCDTGNDPGTAFVVENFADRVGARLHDAPCRNAVSFKLDDEISGPEAYSIKAAGDSVEVSASSSAGLYYGGVTVWQVLTSSPDYAASVAKNGRAPALEIPAFDLFDEPEFNWRGFFLDSARHFQSVEDIKKIIDWMSLHKLNRFQWGLTNDQGWRVEIEAFPRLTEVAAFRPGPAPGSGKCGGYYSKHDIRQIVEYAQDRNVTVVPEINFPGHSLAAIYAYPELGSLSHTATEIPSRRGFFENNTLNIDAETFGFVETVLAEVFALFPGEFVHIGGDEIDMQQWNHSPRVQQRVRELELGSASGAQTYFLQRMTEFARSHGKTAIGWDESFEADPPQDLTIMAWRTAQIGAAAANAGHKVILSPQVPFYMDWPQSLALDEPVGIGTPNTLEMVHGFDPYALDLTEDGRSNLLGLQVNLWTEDTPDFATVMYRLFPRSAAFAEVAWSGGARGDWAGFQARLPAMLARYETLGIVYADSAFAPEILLVGTPRASAESVTVSLASQVDIGEIRYTVDGSDPHSASCVYRDAFTVTVPATVRAGRFLSNKQIGSIRERAISRDAHMTAYSHDLRYCRDTPHTALTIAVPDAASSMPQRYVTFFPASCWTMRNAPMDGVRAIDVTFVATDAAMLGSRAPMIVSGPGRTPGGELTVHADGCDSSIIGEATLEQSQTYETPVTVRIDIQAARLGSCSLCFQFAGEDPVIRSIGKVELHRSGSSD